MKYGLSDKQLREIVGIISSYPQIEQALIFGSRAIDTYKEASDVDIAIKGNKADSKLAAALKDRLEEESYLPFFFDVIAYNSVQSEELKKHVRTKGKSIYRKGLEGWREVKLGEVATLNYGQSLPERKRISGDIPVYSSAGLTGWHNKSLIENEGIIIGRKGNVGSVYRSDTPFFPIDTVFYISDNDTNCNLGFLFYMLSNIKLKNLNSDSAVPGLNRNAAYAQKINLPPLPEQKAIAEVLSSLDDKIALLHRQNKTLEDMAQALFRKWFIDEADTGWEKKPLDKIADYLNGLACQKHPPKNQSDRLPVLKIRELGNGFTEHSDWTTSEVDKKYIVTSGDVVFSWSGSLMLKIWHGQDCVLNQHLFKVTSLKYPKWFYYLWTKHHLEKFIAIANSKATTMGHIKRGDLSNSAVLTPQKGELSEMHGRMAPIFEKMFSNQSQISTLTNLRDDLLPKLMSGEVRLQTNKRGY